MNRRCISGTRNSFFPPAAEAIFRLPIVTGHVEATACVRRLTTSTRPLEGLLT